MNLTPFLSRFANARVVALGLLTVLVLVLIGKLLFGVDATPTSAVAPVDHDSHKHR